MTSYRKALTTLYHLLCLLGAAALVSAQEKSVIEEKPAAEQAAAEKAGEVKPDEGPKEQPAAEETPAATDDADEPEMDDDAAKERAEEAKEREPAAVARPVSADPVQVYGWREWIVISDGKMEQKLQAKLDTGALTSSIHAEEKELFERDGKKWLRFVATDPGEKDSPRLRIEAPLVRIARIKEPGGESMPREVVRLSFHIGDRKLRADFTLNNRDNMLSPVLIGRSTIKELGWIDPSRAYLADKKVMR